MTDKVNYKWKVDITDLYKYIGEARPGTATSESKWKILRINLATSECLWAASGDYQAIWDNRASLNYT